MASEGTNVNLVLLSLREGAAAKAGLSSFSLWLLQDVEDVFSIGLPGSSSNLEKIPGLIWARFCVLASADNGDFSNATFAETSETVTREAAPPRRNPHLKGRLDIPDGPTHTRLKHS